MAAIMRSLRAPTSVVSSSTHTSDTSKIRMPPREPTLFCWFSVLHKPAYSDVRTIWNSFAMGFLRTTADVPSSFCSTVTRCSSPHGQCPWGRGAASQA